MSQSRTNDELWNLFTTELYADLAQEQLDFENRPLLAHYTSIETLERIFRTDEFWLSHPLLMTDVDELRFGVLEGELQFRSNGTIREACGSPERFEKLSRAFDEFLRRFDNEDAFDIYIGCFSAHDPSKPDGRLSMWRGYGGNGAGAAVVFDTRALGEIAQSPLVLSKVSYGSYDARRAWLNDKVSALGSLLKASDVPDDQLWIPAGALFERITLFSLFSKHAGFAEEDEWRVVYWARRDGGQLLTSMLDHHLGAKGIEPKLKLQVRHIPGATHENMTLENLVSDIILGPSSSSPLAAEAFRRMLRRIGKPSLAEKVRQSRIPFRSR